jgi:hypothetical protein
VVHSEYRFQQGFTVVWDDCGNIADLVLLQVYGGITPRRCGSAASSGRAIA